MKALALALLLAAVAGCATLPACPGKGGPAWTELTSAHFVVRTDLRVEDGEELVKVLEETRASLLAVVWPKAPEPPGRTQVIAVESQRELSAYVPTFVHGMRISRPPFAPTLLVGPHRGREELGVVAHELTHELAHHFLPLQPSWYSEGIATFVESLAYSRRSRSVTIGATPLERLRDIYVRGLVPAETLLSATEVPPGIDGVRFESSSWLLFHYLVNNHPDGLTRYQNLVRALVPSGQAWKEAFPGLTFDRLDKELGRYRSGGQYNFVERPVTAPTVMIATRPLRDAEVHALRAYLFTAPFVTPQPEASDELAEVFRQEPDNVEALGVVFYGGPTEKRDLALARRANAAQPKSWLAAVMLADAVGPTDPSGHAALVRALVETPRSAELTRRLAAWEGAAGNWGAARQFAELALRLGAPIDKPLLELFAEALARTGSCTQSAFVMERVGQHLTGAEGAKADALGAALNALCSQRAPAGSAPPAPAAAPGSDAGGS